MTLDLKGEMYHETLLAQVYIIFKIKNKKSRRAGRAGDRRSPLDDNSEIKKQAVDKRSLKFSIGWGVSLIKLFQIRLNLIARGMLLH